jgi:hypothetical protein
LAQTTSRFAISSRIEFPRAVMELLADVEVLVAQMVEIEHHRDRARRSPRAGGS